MRSCFSFAFGSAFILFYALILFLDMLQFKFTFHSQMFRYITLVYCILYCNIVPNGRN